MKKFYMAITPIAVLLAMLFTVLLATIFISCEALPFNYSAGQSWLIRENEQEKILATLTLLGVQVDRSGGWDSVEKETVSLAPLYFWNQGCKTVAAEEGPAYAAGIQVREREFNLGWRTKRSLAVEVRIWVFEDAPKGGVSVHEQKLPVAVGRIVSTGEESFSSSHTTGRLLSMAIEKAVKQLAEYERKKNA